eukprot:8399175-Alexandrium_andersonii.AAC.1
MHTRRGGPSACPQTATERPAVALRHLPGIARRGANASGPAPPSASLSLWVAPSIKLTSTAPGLQRVL